MLRARIRVLQRTRVHTRREEICETHLVGSLGNFERWSWFFLTARSNLRSILLIPVIFNSSSYEGNSPDGE